MKHVGDAAMGVSRKKKEYRRNWQRDISVNEKGEKETTRMEENGEKREFPP